jgi:hypothetical protein
MPKNVITESERQEWAAKGVTLVEHWPDFVEVKLHGERVGKFGIQFNQCADPDEIRKSVQKLIERSEL